MGCNGLSNVGGNIRKIRKEMKKTQEEMAQTLGISRSYLANLEAGRKNVGENTIKKMSKNSGLSIYYLTTGRKTTSDLSSTTTESKSMRDMSDAEKKQALKHVTEKLKKDNEEFRKSLKEKLFNLSQVDLSVTESYFLDAMIFFLMDIERFKEIDDDEDLLFMAALLKTIHRKKNIALEKDVNMKDLYKDIDDTTNEVKSFLERYYGITDINKG